MTSTTESPPARDDLVGCLSPAVSGAAPACKAHPGAPADALCTDCSGLFCWECLQYDAEADAFRCAACTDRHRLGVERRRRWAFLRQPWFYVVALVVTAGIAYAAGVGNPSLRSLARADAGREWPHREAGAVCLRQAERTARRALQLLERKQDASLWCRLSATAYAAVVESWHDSPVANCLRLSAVTMLLHVDRADGNRRLQALAAQVPDADLARLPCDYLLGREALQAGDREQATTAWNRCLDRITAERPRSVGEAIGGVADLVSSGRTETVLKGRLRLPPGVPPTLDAMETDIRRQAKSERLVLKGEPAGPGALPGLGRLPGDDEEAGPDEAVPAKPKPKPKLVIERYDGPR